MRTKVRVGLGVVRLGCRWWFVHPRRREGGVNVRQYHATAGSPTLPMLCTVSPPMASRRIWWVCPHAICNHFSPAREWRWFDSGPSLHPLVEPGVDQGLVPRGEEPGRGKYGRQFRITKCPSSGHAVEVSGASPRPSWRSTAPWRSGRMPGCTKRGIQPWLDSGGAILGPVRWDHFLM